MTGAQANISIGTPLAENPECEEIRKCDQDVRLVVDSCYEETGCEYVEPPVSIGTLSPNRSSAQLVLGHQMQHLMTEHGLSIERSFGWSADCRIYRVLASSNYGCSTSCLEA
jgi:hypothetical protein